MKLFTLEGAHVNDVVFQSREEAQIAYADAVQLILGYERKDPTVNGPVKVWELSDGRRAMQVSDGDTLTFSVIRG